MMKRDGIDRDGQSEKVRKTLRGRAEKACVRCRAKKRTCDGGNPCLRCKESHSACYFSDWHYTVPYPREYVEYLEEQQEQLSTGLMTLYRILKESNIQTVPVLPDNPQAQDLLAALKVLRLDSRSLHSMRSNSTAADTLKDGYRIHGNDIPALPEYRPGSVPGPMHHTLTSPLQPAPMSMPHFGSAYSPNLMAYAQNSTPAHHIQSRAFEFAQPTHSQLVPQTQSLPQAHTTTHREYMSPRDGVMHMPESWQPSPLSLTPSTNTPLHSRSDRSTPLAISPKMFADTYHESMHVQQHYRQNASPP